MNEVDKVKAKIKKLLALSASPSPAEAASALRMARQLMAEYKLDRGDINALDISEERAATKCRDNPPLYESHLTHCIGRAFGCEQVYHVRSGLCAWGFIGLKHRAEIAAFITQVLLRKLHKARTEYLETLYRVRSRYRKTQRADDFCFSWVLAVTEKIPAFAGRSPEETREITIFVEKNYPSLSDLNSLNRSFGQPIDSLRGRQAGEGVELQSGVSIGSGPRLIPAGGKAIGGRA